MVLISWKTYKGTHSNHIRQKKIEESPQNDENYQISVIFGISWHILEKRFSLKNLKVYIIRKKILSVFYCFLFYENILTTSAVIDY